MFQSGLLSVSMPNGSRRQNTDQLIGDPAMIGGAEFGHPPMKAFHKGKLVTRRPPEAVLKTPQGDIVRLADLNQHIFSALTCVASESAPP